MKTRSRERRRVMALHKPVCFKCGAEVEPGTLFTHVKAEHPAPVAAPPKPRVCKRVKCLAIYGPLGHVPAEGPHAY
jgi:hypothetical protein